MLLRSGGAADASLPTLLGLYCGGTCAAAGVAALRPGRRTEHHRRIARAIAATVARPRDHLEDGKRRQRQQRNHQDVGKAAPKPSSAPARPDPARCQAAQHGAQYFGPERRGCRHVAVAGLAAAAVVALCAGAPGAAGGVAASRCVTLLDRLPTDLPPPSRRAASASACANASITTNTTDHSFIMTSPSPLSTEQTAQRNLFQHGGRQFPVML